MCDGKHLWHFRHSKVHISVDIKENGICHPKIWPLMSASKCHCLTYRDEDVEEILESRKLRDEPLHNLGESLKDGVVVNTGQVETTTKQTHIHISG